MFLRSKKTFFQLDASSSKDLVNLVSSVKHGILALDRGSLAVSPAIRQHMEEYLNRRSLAIFDTLSPSELMLAVFQGSRTPFITRMLLVQIAVRYTGRSVVWLK